MTDNCKLPSKSEFSKYYLLLSLYLHFRFQIPSPHLLPYLYFIEIISFTRLKPLNIYRLTSFITESEIFFISEIHHFKLCRLKSVLPAQRVFNRKPILCTQYIKYAKDIISTKKILNI